VEIKVQDATVEEVGAVEEDVNQYEEKEEKEEEVFLVVVVEVAEEVEEVWSDETEVEEAYEVVTPNLVSHNMDSSIDLQSARNESETLYFQCRVHLKLAPFVAMTKDPSYLTNNIWVMTQTCRV